MKSTLDAVRVWLSMAALLFISVASSLSYGSLSLPLIFAVMGVLLAFIWLVPSAGQITGLGWIGLVLTLLGFAWSVLQLVPLPPAVWQTFAGRGFLTESATALGVANSWLPLSLSPGVTADDLIAVLPAIGFLCCGLCLPYDKRSWFAATIVFAAVLNVLFGLGVRYAHPGPESALGVFANSNFVTGFFLNRNFFAALLYVSVPMLVALLLQLVARGQLNKVTGLALGVIYLGLILVGLAASGSRTGIILAMGSLLVSPFLARGLWVAVGNRAISRLALIGMLVAFVTVGQFGLVAISRLARVDPVNDQRFTMYSNTARAIGDYLPWGSGFGSFVPVYQRYERPSDMIGNAYINHAHNDWLELALEGGLPMALLMAVALLVILGGTIAAWRRPLTRAADLGPRAASLAVWLLMLHSVVDYPLRTPALMAVFGLCVGLLLAVPAPVKAGRSSGTARAPSAPAAPRPAAPRPDGPLWPQGKGGMRRDQGPAR